MEQRTIPCEVLVVGSGAGGVSAAYTAAREGLEVVLVEAADRFGGTTAYSGGGALWYPANPVLQAAGSTDSTEVALDYYRAVVGERTPAALQERYVRGGPEVIEYLLADEHFRFTPLAWPDYFGELPGAQTEGQRQIIPTPFPAADLGPWHEVLRGTLDTDRLGAPAPELLSGGRALIGQFLLALSEFPNATLLRNTPLVSLSTEHGRVVGATVDHLGERIEMRASRGVILAAGGFEQSAEMRERYGVPGAPKDSMGPATNTGVAHRAAQAVGAAVDLMDQAWWTPGVVHPDGGAVFTLDFPAGIFVDGDGKRFLNESMPYDRAGRIVIDHLARDEPAPRFWYVYDDRGGEAPPFGVPMVSMQDPAAYAAAGLRHTAATLADLAALIEVPAEALEATVSRFNDLVAAGSDADFGRGESHYDRFFSGEKPLTPIERGPFHAAAFGLSDLGTKGGLRTDTSARVLDEQDRVIPGLYATGNTMAAPSGEAYPGGGNPIGTSLLFGHLAALDLAAQEPPAETPGLPETAVTDAVAHYLAAIASGTGSRIAERFADSAVVEDPVGAEPVRGIEAISAFYAALDGNDAVRAVLTDEVRVLAHQAVFGLAITMTAGGTETTIRPINVMTLDTQGKITSMRSYYGTPNITQQA